MRVVASANDPGLREQLKQHGDEGNTAQGLYIVGADGRCYGWMNDHNIEEVQKFLQRGLVSFRTHPPSHVQISPALLSERFSTTPDPTTSVIRVFTRIRPMPSGADESNNGIGRDHLWILSNEVKQISAPLHDNGLSFALPSAFVTRLVRYHLIDNVRGEPDMWKSNEVKKTNFSARYIGGTASVKCYELHGVFAQRTSDGKRGIEGRLDGQLEVQVQPSRISKFRAVGQAQAWGASRFTPGVPAGRFPIVIGMLEANDGVSRVVPPQAMDQQWADYYLNPGKSD